MKNIKSYISVFLLLVSLSFKSTAQNTDTAYWASLDWDDVVSGKVLGNNFASEDAIRIAKNVMLYQKAGGGWPKNTKMQVILSQSETDNLIAEKPNNSGSTIDNSAVKMELEYLSKAYRAIEDTVLKAEIKTSFLKGIQYLLDAQYDNGGWPQFYPYRKNYSDHITYNDNAMVNVMNIMRRIYEKDSFYSITAADSTIAQAQTAFNKGIECILKTQYIQNDTLTVWCAQHHYITLEPIKARSYELASLSGAESKGIISLLMSIDNPSYEIKKSIYYAVKWYDKNRIVGYRQESFINDDGLNDKRVVPDSTAPDMWARFYTLKDNIPFFCGRDGIMKFSLAEIELERRTGYSWYTSAGHTVMSEYKSWLVAKEINIEQLLNISYPSIANTFKCYPNPAYSNFYIDLNAIGKSTVEIYNLSGQLVYNNIAEKDILNVNDHNLSSGLYLVKVTDKNFKIHTQKLIIK